VGNRAVQRILAPSPQPTVGSTKAESVSPLLSQRAPVIQRKRAASTGDPLNKGAQAIEDYDKSAKKGAELRTTLQAWQASLSQMAQKSGQEASVKGKRTELTTRQKIEAGGYKTLVGTMGTGRKLKMASSRQKTPDSQKYQLAGFTESPYVNEYDPTLGQLTAQYNTREKDVKEGGKDAPHNSNMLWYQFRRAQQVDAQSQQQGKPIEQLFEKPTEDASKKDVPTMPLPKVSAMGKLKTVRRDPIVNPQTLNTIYWADKGLEVNNQEAAGATVVTSAIVRDDDDFDNPFPSASPPKLTEESATQGDADFWALLGTPNGQGVAHLMMDHGHKFGAIDIPKITYGAKHLIFEYKIIST
jgi:hypothetical protein